MAYTAWQPTQAGRLLAAFWPPMPLPVQSTHCPHVNVCSIHFPLSSCLSSCQRSKPCVLPKCCRQRPPKSMKGKAKGRRHAGAAAASCHAAMTMPFCCRQCRVVCCRVLPAVLACCCCRRHNGERAVSLPSSLLPRLPQGCRCRQRRVFFSFYADDVKQATRLHTTAAAAVRGDEPPV